MRVCAHDGCPILTAEPYCPQHVRQRRQTSDAKRQATRSNYGHRRWRRVRRHYLRRHPLCECGCGRIATVVHHLDGQGLQGPNAYNPDQLEALAKVCHDRITAQEQPGGWNAPTPPR